MRNSECAARSASGSEPRDLVEQHAAAVDGAAQPDVERVDERGHGRQQEDRRDGELDDARNVVDVGFHRGRQPEVEFGRARRGRAPLVIRRS